MEPAGGCAVKRYFTLSLQSKRSQAGGEIAPVNEVEEGEYKRPGTANQGELRQAGRAREEGKSNLNAHYQRSHEEYEGKIIGFVQSGK